MKISSIRIDSARIEGGDWVGDIPGLGDLRLKVRGIDNRDYRRLHAKLLDGVGPDERDEAGKILEKVADDISAELLFKTVLLDWDGLEAEASTPTAPIAEPYAKELAFQYLTDPDYAVFRDGVAWAALKVANRLDAQRRADAGN